MGHTIGHLKETHNNMATSRSERSGAARASNGAAPLSAATALMSGACGGDGIGGGRGNKGGSLGGGGDGQTGAAGGDGMGQAGEVGGGDGKSGPMSEMVMFVIAKTASSMEAHRGYKAYAADNGNGQKRVVRRGAGANASLAPSGPVP